MAGNSIADQIVQLTLLDQGAGNGAINFFKTVPLIIEVIKGSGLFAPRSNVAGNGVFQGS